MKADITLKITAVLHLDKAKYDEENPEEVEARNLERDGLANYLATLEDLGATITHIVRVRVEEE